MSTLLPELPEPMARLLEWRGPAHMPVPHAGVAARTFAEFAKDTPVERRYWFEGEPLFTADQVRAIQLEAWKAAMEAAAQAAATALDMKEEARAEAQTRTAKEMGDELRALRHYSTVSTYNAGVRRCVSAIRSLPLPE